MKSLILPAVLILSRILISKAQDICDDGWIRFEDYYSSGVCVLVRKEPAEWKVAMKYCEERLGNLLVLDNYGELSYFEPREDRTISLGEEIVGTYSIEEFWSGMHIDNGRLMWDDYGPKLVEKSKFFGSRFWRWSNGQPDPMAGKCGKATVTKRQTDGGVTYDYNKVSVNLTRCSTELPFVCRKEPTRRIVKTAAFCPENWLGNQYIPHCYRIYKEPVTYDKAKARCQEEDSSLAPSNSLFDLTFAEIVYMFYLENDKYFELTNVGSIWVMDTNSTKACSALDTSPSERSGSAVTDTDCLASLLFMCVKSTKYAGFGYIETESDYFDQKKLLEYDAFEPLPVYGVLDRNLQENEVIFVRTPSFILNSSNSYYQWNFDNTLSWRVQESSRVSTPYYVNLTLPFNQSPLRRRRGVDGNYAYGSEIHKRQADEFGTTPNPFDEGEVFRFINYYNVRETTGYYTFGIYNTNPPRYLERKPQLVRYSEKDLYIYVAYCDFLDYVVGPSSTEPFVSTEDINAFNLLHDDSYIGSIREMGLSSVLNRSPVVLGNLVANYSAKIESFEGNTVKFRVFVAPSASRQQSAATEQFVYDAVKEHFRLNLPSDYFNLRTLKVKSTVMCPFTQTVKDGKNLTFNPIRIGETGFSWERCYPHNKALATSTCRGGYDDGTALRDISLAENCGSPPVYNKSESTANLKNLSETEITKDNFETVLNDTANLTRPGLNLTEADVIYTAEILYNYLQFDIVNTPEVMATVFKVVDNVLRSGADVIDTAQKITNAANRIIQSVDDLTNELGLAGKNYVQFIQDLVASEVWEQTGGDDVTIGISLNQTGAKEIKKDALSSVRDAEVVEITGTDTAIYLTETLLKGGRSRLTFHIYGNTDLFSVISGRFKVNSKVAAARLTKNNTEVVNLGDEYVTAVFYPFEDSKGLVCAYWNYSANEDAGSWNTEGCTLFSYESGRVVCKCNHLTNFAVLIDLQAGSISDTDKLVLDIITKVGLCISIVGLGITILTFLIFKHLRNGRGQQVLVNLSVAMLCSSIIYLVGIDRTESYGGCIAVAVLLHYFILVTFMWMLVEGLLQYLRFVKVLGTYIPKFMTKSMIPAWGIPLIPVIVVLAIDYDMYYGGNGYCWLSWNPFLYAFIIPIAVIVLANIIVFFMVMCNLCCRRKHKGMVSNQSDRKMAFLHFQAGISILVILGLTWVFGFLTVDSTRIVFHYLFAIFNAFQGFFIFLLFTSREKQIRKAWRKLCCKASPYKSTTSGSGTDSHPSKKSADTTNSTGLLSKSGGSSSIATNGDRKNGNGFNHFDNPQYDNGI
ncbi:uncharacterized protein LOC123538400 [Mercenaria mercenaria]|uniref:uncharacterized protein LOC123538400 n=1 Tax=Mercenaria mercenaria TaxID=6596 RepID=UPI00234ED7A7|nr:uncharacterized protein LOC123538400 [Mercenaria mercenaria]